jgi:Caspase domain
MGMSQLTSAALSAFRMAQWLERRADRLTAPLATLRLLLSPSEREVEDVEPALATVAEPCIFEALRSEVADWRDDASGRSDDVTLFYFAGHGVQRVKGDAVMLCEDFGDGVGGVLDRAISGVNLYNGMAPAPGREGIARTQFYFIDACRIRPDAFSQYEPLTPGRCGASCSPGATTGVRRSSTRPYRGASCTRGPRSKRCSRPRSSPASTARPGRPRTTTARRAVAQETSAGCSRAEEISTAQAAPPSRCLAARRPLSSSVT